jgi:DNA invertase Pin-like site-specific DNA recombinase
MARADIETILRLSDSGMPVAAIAEAAQLTQRRVYAILRENRPNRSRTPRKRTSDKPREILGLYERNINPAQIALVLGVTRSYVYRVLGEAHARGNITARGDTGWRWLSAPTRR